MTDLVWYVPELDYIYIYKGLAGASKKAIFMEDKKIYESFYIGEL